MQTRYRCFPPALPLKFTKLIKYDYFYKIYKKYDCNFFRQILPYFSQIVSTNKLQTNKFVYVPIQNPNKVKNIQIGVPFKHYNQSIDIDSVQLAQQVTFIKISQQAHVIFEHFMDLDLQNCGIPRLMFQEKFWLFSEGIIRHYKFNEIIFQKENDQYFKKGIYIILQGQYRCTDSYKKTIKIIGKGFLIDLEGNLTKIKWYLSCQKSRQNHQKRSQMFTVQQQTKKNLKQTSNFHCLWSNSNNCKVLFIESKTVAKYIDIQTVTEKSSIFHKMIQKQENIKIQQQAAKPISLYRKKYHKMNTENNQNYKKRYTYQQQINQNQNPGLKKKFKLLSCRLSTNPNQRKSMTNDYQQSIQKIKANQILCSYIKDHQIFQKMKKYRHSQCQKKENRNYSLKNQNERILIKRKQQKLLSFFKKEINNHKQKQQVSKKKHDRESVLNHRQNRLTFDCIEKGLNRQSYGIEERTTTKKLKKIKLKKFQLSSHQLFQRNLFNKKYHEVRTIK